MDYKDFPLVLSMTELSYFRRCRKKFDLAAIRGLSPRQDSDAAGRGRAFHAIMEAVAKDPDHARPTEGDHEMLPIAQAYYDHLRESGEWPFDSVISAERGYFAEIAPSVFIRCSFDLVWQAGSEAIVQDYKTFSRAPSIEETDHLDPQANDYLFVASAALGLKRVKFRWEYVRQELGRMLKKDKSAVYVPWEPHERYFRQEMILGDDVMETVERELYETAMDVREAIERGRYYRSGQKGGGYDSCSACFYRHLCSAEFWHGELTPGDIESLATFDDPAERTSIETILEDPRVKWYEGRGATTPEAIRNVYGQTGVKKYALSHYTKELEKNG